MTIDGMKRCPRCRRTLPLDSFAGDASKRVGVKSWCKACDAERARQYHARTGSARRSAARAAKRSAAPTPAAPMSEGEADD